MAGLLEPLPDIGGKLGKAFLDKSGLTYIWTKALNTFAKKSEIDKIKECLIAQGLNKKWSDDNLYTGGLSSWETNGSVPPHFILLGKVSAGTYKVSIDNFKFEYSGWNKSPDGFENCCVILGNNNTSYDLYNWDTELKVGDSFTIEKDTNVILCLALYDKIKDDREQRAGKPEWGGTYNPDTDEYGGYTKYTFEGLALRKLISVNL